MCVNFSDTVKICWFFFTCLNKIGETFSNWLAVFIYFDEAMIKYYGIIQVLINFAPFLWALTAYLVQKRRNENSVLTKGEFLWQIPIAFEVRNFMLWKRLKDTINLFVTSKIEFSISPILEFKVLHKSQRAF